MILSLFMLFFAATSSAQLVPSYSINESALEMPTLNSHGIRQAILCCASQMGSLAFQDSMHGAGFLPPRDPWFSMDKFQHAAFSFFIATGTQYAMVNKLDFSEREALPISIGTSLLTGVSKEVYDKKVRSTAYFSYKDLVADGAGILLAVGLILL